VAAARAGVVEVSTLVIQARACVVAARTGTTAAFEK